MYLQVRELTKCRRLLRDIVASSSNYKLAATYNLGIAFFQEFKDWAYEQAIHYFEQLIDNDEVSNLARQFTLLGHCGLASVYAQIFRRVHSDQDKYFEKFMEHYQLAIQDVELLPPGEANLVRATVLTAKGTVLYHQDRISEALESLHEAIYWQGNYVMPYIYLSDISLQGNQYEEAEAYMDQALKYNPTSSYLHYKLGQIYEACEKPDLSEIAYSKAPDISNAQNRFGWLMFQRGRYQEAAKAFKQAITLNSQHADATVNLASCYLWLENVTKEEVNEAINLAQKSLSLKGGNQWYKHLIIGRLYHNQNQLDKALEQFERAVELNSICAQCHYYLAILLNELGDFEDAKRQLIEFFKLPNRDQWEKEAQALMQVLENNQVQE